MPKGLARYALKVDINKAFDIVSWQFIIGGLKAIGIPATMVNWIEVCITMPHFSINLNRELHGFFKSNRGIRQGGPFVTLSFYSSNGGVGWHIEERHTISDFIHHWRCKENVIIHLSFVDDLMMFCHADQNSVWILKHSLGKFAMLSGLSINHTKSSLYLSEVDGQLQESIQQQLGFQQKAPPVKYLGVPFITTLLTHKNCLSLVERITYRIKL